MHLVETITENLILGVTSVTLSYLVTSEFLHLLLSLATFIY